MLSQDAFYWELVCNKAIDKQTELNRFSHEFLAISAVSMSEVWQDYCQKNKKKSLKWSVDKTNSRFHVAVDVVDTFNDFSPLEQKFLFPSVDDCRAWTF